MKAISKTLLKDQLSFPLVVSGNPDSAFWTSHRNILEKRIRGKSGLTPVFEIACSLFIIEAFAYSEHT
jgi:hypothetical protein